MAQQKARIASSRQDLARTLEELTARLDPIRRPLPHARRVLARPVAQARRYAIPGLLAVGAVALVMALRFRHR